jgi:hypothetical protein
MDSIIVNGIEYVKKTQASNLVIIRTYSAGVHVGELESQDGKVVKLKNACRIWRWRGANTLNEIALNGIITKEYSRVSEIVPEITLTEAIEVIPVSAAAAKTLVPVWNI